MKIRTKISLLILMVLVLLPINFVFAYEELNKSIPIKSASELDYPPFSVINEDGEADGFSVELLKSTLNAVDLNVEFYVGPWSEIKEDLTEGRIQVLPLVGRTPERESIYDFTVPYITLNGAMFVRKGDTSIKTIEDLVGKEVIVMKGDNAEEFVRREAVSDNIITTETFEEAFKLLSSGKHDVAITQKVMGLQLLKQLEIDNVIPVSEIKKFKQDFTFAVKEGDSELLSNLNEGLSIIKINGTFDKIYDKWFEEDVAEIIEEEKQTFAKESIKQKAEDVAKQIEIYLKAYPDKTIKDLQEDAEFQEIAVQPVGKTGYTAIVDYDRLITGFHKQESQVNLDLHAISDKAPGFFNIISQSKGGKVSYGFYDWKDDDGKVREKFNYQALVDVKTADGVGFVVSATTYLDEYEEDENILEEKDFAIEDSIQKTVLLNIQKSKEQFYDLQEKDTDLLKGLLTDFMEKDEYKQIFLEGDREKLSEYSQELFNENKVKHATTHFYYHRPDGTNFVRVHNTNVFDDEIKRITFKKSKESDSWGTGIELGKTAFALRVVHPYYRNDELIGYVEFGQEIDHFIQELKRQSGSDYGIVVKKEYIDKENWASVRREKGLRNNYDDMSDYVLIDSTDESKLIFNEANFDQVNFDNVSDEGNVFHEYRIGDKTYVDGGFSLFDAGGNKVGAVVLAHDVSNFFDTKKETSSLIYLATFLLVIFVVISALLLRRKFFRAENVLKVRTFSIRIKLLFIFGFLLIIFIVFALISVNNSNELTSNADDLYRHPFAVSTAALRINASIVKINRDMKDVVLVKNEEDLSDILSLIDVEKVKIYEDMAIIKKQFLGDLSEVDKFELLFNEWESIREREINLVKQGRIEEAISITKNEGAVHIEKLENSIDNFTLFAQKKAEEFNSSSVIEGKEALVRTYFLILIIVILIIVFGIYFSKSITKPIRQLFIVTEKLRKGNFEEKVDIKTGDELEILGDNFNLMAKEIFESKVNLEKRVAERTAQLEKTNKFMIGRELKMIELKKEILKLKQDKNYKL